MFHEFFGDDDEEDDDGGGGFSVGVPGTDYRITTDRSEATVWDPVGGAQDLADPTEPAEWVPGVTETRERDRFREEQRRAQEGGRLAQFDAAVATGMDFLLDHPGGSVQETTRSGLTRATGLSDEELAERAREIDEGVTESIDERVGGTALDHRGTDAVRWVGDTLIGEGARVFVGAGTGIDTREGDLDARTGALETADVGLTIGTAGLGRAGIGAVRAARSGEGVTDLFRAGRTGRTRQIGPAIDTTPSAAARTTAGTRAAGRGPSPRTGDGPIDMVRGSDGVFSLGPRTARTADDAATATARTADDALPVAARTADDALPAVTRTARTTDDFGAAAARTFGDVGTTGTRAARTVEDVGTAGTRLSDRIGQTLSRVGDQLGIAGIRLGSGARAATRSRPARFGAAGAALGAGVIGGGALINELSDRYEMADGTVLVATDTFQPTERFEGGLLYMVKEEDGPTLGYSVVVGQEGRNLIMLDPDGNPTRAPLDVDELSERERGGGQF